MYIQSKNRKGSGKKIGPLVKTGVGRGEIVEDDREVATLLNEHFCSVFNREKCGDIQINRACSSSRVISLDNINITNEDVIKALGDFKVNKSPGIDNITWTYALKLKEALAEPLKVLFNKSRELNEIPRDWKKGNITPIYKTGKKSSAENYRPISLTAFFGKVFEKIIKKYIEIFLEANSFINKTQHGFMKGMSCMTNLLICQNSVMSMLDEGAAVDIIYLDFQKAFDKVPHRRLMCKIREAGIGGKLGDWIENWLGNRIQRVIINGSNSDWAEVMSGVPQGSILGPLLFTAYINDLDDRLINRVLKFADDTKIWGRVNSNEERSLMQEDLRILSEWSDSNAMPFNVSKCKVMHLGKKNIKGEYVLKGQKLTKTNEEKDLGVFFSESYKPSLNYNKVSKSANKIIGLIRRNIVNKTKESMLILYKT